MKTFNVYVSETYSGYVEIEAEDIGDAEEKLREKLINGDIVPHIDFDGDAVIEAEEIK